MKTAKLSQKYQVVIPREVRKKMKLQAGARLTIYPLDEERAVIVKHPGKHVDALRGLGSEIWSKLGGAQAYIQKERASWDKR